MRRGAAMRGPGLLLAAGIAVSCACFSPGMTQARKENDFKLLGLLCHTYHDVNRRLPAGWADLIAFCQEIGDPDGARVAQQLQSEGVVVPVWGWRLQDMTDGTSNTLLAYQPQTPQSGGIVATADGAVRHVSAAEFAQLVNLSGKTPPAE